MLKVISNMQTLMSAVRELTVVSRSAITLLVLTHVAVHDDGYRLIGEERTCNGNYKLCDNYYGLKFKL